MRKGRCLFCIDARNLKDGDGGATAKGVQPDKNKNGVAVPNGSEILQKTIDAFLKFRGGSPDT